MIWTDERIEFLKSRWADGRSASQIASELGGITRNAVIGKVHRLGLTGRARLHAIAVLRRPAAPRRTPSRVRKVLMRAEGPARQEATPAAPAPEVVFDEPPPIDQRCTLLELTDDRCHWPFGDPGAEDFYYCGAPTCDDGGVYCIHHACMAHQATQAPRAPAPRYRNGDRPGRWR